MPSLARPVPWGSAVNQKPLSVGISLHTAIDRRESHSKVFSGTQNGGSAIDVRVL